MSRLFRAVQIFTYLGVSSILVGIAFTNIFLGAAGLCWLPIGILESWRNRRIAIQWPPFFWAIQLFVASTVLSVLLSSDPHLGFRALRKIPLFLLCFLVVRFFDFSWVKRTFLTLFALGSLAGVVASVQFFVKWARFQQTMNPADDPTLIFRVTGFMGHWMTFSGEQLLVFSALLAFLVLYPIRRMWLWGLATIILTISIILSFTRSVWLATAIVMGVVLCRYRRKILLMVPVVAILLVLVFPSAIGHRLRSFLDTQFASNQGRIEMARAGWQMFRSHPWFGVGASRIRPEFDAYLKEKGQGDVGYYRGHLHNNFIQLAAERGIFALIAFTWLIMELILRFWRGSHRISESIEWRTVYLAGLLSTIGLLFAGLFEFNFGDSEILILFLFLISAPYASHGSSLTPPGSVISMH